MGSFGAHAVVVGGSMAGLAAARVLADRFDEVTVVERDHLPGGAVDRRGVPQGGHAHALLVSGNHALEELFPGLTDELVTAGAVAFDPGSDVVFHQMGGARLRFASGMLGISLSRALLEHTVRSRVAALPAVRIRDRIAVCGLTGSAGRVTGVELDGGETLAADLVVDATGHSGARTDRWLRALGCPVPGTATVKVDIGYTTRLLRREPGERLADGALLYLIAGVPPHDRRAAAVLPVEDGRWVVTLAGWHGAHAPADPRGFAGFAAGLPAPHIGELVARARPADDGGPRKFTYPRSRRRFFERLRTPPAGLVTVGDALCSFNPVYGQGMSVAALEAIQLGRCLDRFGTPSAPMARAYYRAAARVVAAPWQLATGGDFMYPETAGPRPPGTGLVNRYVRLMLRASHVSVEAHRVVLGMQHLLVPPSAALRPATVVRTLLAARRARRGAGPS
ncbi:FAD-dependent oxidoreductase [Streptomyces sp. NPDC004065]|uniref:FAD-dependent oxidoreductase n=1 Tax=Streptomyces sp. NPDC004065 TaxID=3364689 RepID=UPI00384B1D4D